MYSIFGLLCLVAVMGFSGAYPSRYGYYPKRAVMFGGYYSNPRYAREGYEYNPQGQMTAMVAGDTVATNSFSGQHWNPPPAVLTVPVDAEQPEEYPASEQITETNRPIVVPVQVPEDLNNETEPSEEQPQQPQNYNQETLISLEEANTEEAIVSSTKATVVKVSSASKKVTKPVKKSKKPVVVPHEEEDEEEDDGLEGNWPFGGARRGRIPSYNAFFPIFIGGSSPSARSRTRSSESEDAGAFPGSATAIANSFSTGKGGVATSHATSFGDPYAAAMLRNSGLFNFKTKSKQQPQLED